MKTTQIKGCWFPCVMVPWIQLYEDEERDRHPILYYSHASYSNWINWIFQARFEDWTGMCAKAQNVKNEKMRTAMNIYLPDIVRKPL